MIENQELITTGVESLHILQSKPSEFELGSEHVAQVPKRFSLTEYR